MAKEKLIDDFQVNDTYSFRRTFSAQDFEAFSALSGDENLLHHSAEYAAQTALGSPIVPLHLAAAPLSAIAGMVFPGHRSLYLSHQLKALNPVPYDVEIVYSAKVIAIDTANQVLTLRTVVFHERQLLIEAEQKIQVRDDKHPPLEVESLSLDGRFIQPSSAIMITGAMGALGKCVAQAFASSGHDLVLQMRKQTAEAQQLVEELRARYAVQVEVLTCDLSSVDGQQIATMIASLSQVPSSIIHCASPLLDSDLASLMQVNYTALKQFCDVLLPYWFEQQQGNVVFVSSSATHFHPDGWQDYCAAKAAGVNFCASFNHRFNAMGLNAKVVSPGLINTSFSANAGLDLEQAMLPEQVADAIVELWSSDQHFYSWVEQSMTQLGSYGFFAKQDRLQAAQPIAAATTDPQNTTVQSGAANLEQQLQQLISSQLGLSMDIDWQAAGVAVTPRWDSLNHMLLLVEIERQFGVSISSTDMDNTRTYSQLLNFIQVR